jgi:hypothetical protein
MEDVSEGKFPCRQARLHRRRSSFSAELQCSVWASKVVVEEKDFELILEPSPRACVTCRASGQVRGGLADRQVQTFHERSVERPGIFRLDECLFESPLRTDELPALNPNHAIVPSSLQHLTVEAGDAEEAANDFLVVVESVGHDEREIDIAHPSKCVFEESVGISIAASADDRRWPKSGGDVESREDPHDVVLPAGKRSNLVRLNLCDIELFEVRVVELPTVRSGSLEPAVHGVPADAFDSGDCRLADAFDAQRGDFVEGAATMLKAVVCGVYGRAKGLPTLLAAIAATLAGFRRVEAMANYLADSEQVGQRGFFTSGSRWGRAGDQKRCRRLYRGRDLRSSRPH